MRRRSAIRVSALVAVPLCAALLIGTSAAATPRSTSAIASAVTPAGAWVKAESVPGMAGLNAGGDAVVSALSCSSAGNCSAGGSYGDASGHTQAFVVNETSGTWVKAEEVPGTAALNAGGDAYVSSLSCSSRNCSAGGSYEDASGHTQAFVANETSATWRKAEEVPGTAALNAGGDAEVLSLSCSSAGNCSAGGRYDDASGHTQAFVVNETRGAWAKAEEVPGTASLNAGGDAFVYPLSCSPAGNCSAGGYYTDASGHTQAFVVNETSGTWGKAEEVPGTAALNVGGAAEVNSLSCSSRSNCSAGGDYTDASGHYQAFVVSETSGAWGKAEEVPGTASLNAGGAAYVSALSCSSRSNCSASGSYEDASDHIQAFVVNETSGTWRKAEEVPGTASLNAGGNAEVSSLSCSPAGNCSAGGRYDDASGHTQAFVVNETSGAWAKAEEVPGTASLNAGGDAFVYSLSCSPAGNCSAGGYYTDASGHTQAFVVNETSGTWGKAEEVPGTASLNAGGDAEVNSLSCSPAGNCSAGGSYEDASGHYQAFVVNETSDTWGEAEEVPGTAVLNAGGSDAVDSLSCGSPGNCGAGGSYRDASDHVQAFVVNERSGAWGKAEEVPGTAVLNAGGEATINSLSCRSLGDCSAGGSYKDASGHTQVFVINETSGAWGKAEEVPGMAVLNAGGSAGVNSLSCRSAGNCSAGGYYDDASGHIQAFVVNERSGTWGNGEEVPGTAVLNAGGDAWVNSLSCSSTGNCSAGGSYKDASGHYQAFVVNETSGAWGKAEEVPGTASLNAGGGAFVSSLSCSPAGNCSEGGYYTDASDHTQAFVVNETSGTWRKAEEVPGTAALNADGDAEVSALSCSSAGHCSAGGYYDGRLGPRPGLRRQRDERFLGQGRGGARHGVTQRRRRCLRLLSLLQLCRQLRRSRVLQVRLGPLPGLRRHLFSAPDGHEALSQQGACLRPRDGHDHGHEPPRADRRPLRDRRCKDRQGRLGDRDQGHLAQGLGHCCGHGYRPRRNLCEDQGRPLHLLR